MSADKLTNLLRVAVSTKSAAELKNFVSGLSERTRVELLTALSPVSEDLKKFVCPDCGKAFDRKWNMDRHVETRHAKQDIRCAFVGCDARLESEQALEEHEQRGHGLSTPTKRAKLGVLHGDHYDLLNPSSGTLLHMGEHGVEERHIDRAEGFKAVQEV